MGIRSGKAIITVKAKQNNVFGQIEIEVYSPVTDIHLNVGDIVMQVGDTFKIAGVVSPEDATHQNVRYQTGNNNVVEIDHDGNITANGVGKTKITVSVDEDSISKQVGISVVSKIDEADLSFDKDLTVLANEITGWDENKMTVQEIKDKIHTGYDIEIYNRKGELLKEGELAGTGSKIRILEKDKIVMEYNIILYGDVNGDGKINSVDLLVLQRHILEIEKMTGVFLKAGNIHKNGKNPSSLDCLLIQRHILELTTIEQ